MRVSLAYITLQDNKKGFLLRRRVCRPPAAVPSSEEGSAKLLGGHPPACNAGYKGGTITELTEEKSVEELNEIIREKFAFDNFKPITEVYKSVMETLEANAKRTDEVIGLDTGFRELNKYTQGFQGGQLLILAARPAMGKSAFVLNISIAPPVAPAELSVS